MEQLISCPASGGLAAAATLADRLRDAWDGDGAIVLDLSQVSAVDIGLIQIIEAARIQASAEGRPIRLERPAPPHVAEALNACGLLWESDAEDRRFWFQQGDDT